ncbi:MAG: UDP-N-acetylglucosamine 2-epimerase [Bacteroidales bacterium]|nr:UDP-N-acetylglucosamine 2-epimerase [Bacteroidales bacterium]
MTGGVRKPCICIATSTRADWGLLRPVAESLRDSGLVDLRILATNMHLLERYGMTVDEITSAGFDVDARVPIDEAGDSETARARAMAQCLAGTADALADMRPDTIIILGDRYEMLAVASAAAVMRVPIIHIAGGEISEGAVDDSMRHAITKLSALHLTATEPYRRRVIAMGEQPERVINTGAIGVWNVVNRPMMSRDELTDNLGIARGKDFVVATFHPATLDDADPAEGCRAMLDAIDRLSDMHVILTYPNNDARSAGIIDEIERYAASHSDRVTLVKSLGMARYLPAITYARAVIGNSSSGIVEVPSAGTPTVDIGIRQRGRLAGKSVIHCGTTADEIYDAIMLALSDDMQATAALRENPYCKPDTLDIMTCAILDFTASLPVGPKKFYDIQQC